MNQEQIEKLVVIQELDLKVLEMESFLKKIPGEIDAHRVQLEKQEQEYTDFVHTLKQKRLIIKEKNGVLKDNEEKIQKQRIMLNAAKSNKEYDTIKMQINKFDKENHLMEEEILAIMEEVEKAESEGNQLQAKFEAAKADFEKIKSENDLKVSKTAAEMEAIRLERKSKAAEIQSQHLAKYEKISKAVGGVGIVPVKNGICGGCFSALPPQFINEIVRVDELMSCEYCSRILYVADLNFN